MALRITLGDLIHDCADRFGDRPAVTMAETGESVTYAALEALTNRLAHGLRERFTDDARSGPRYAAVMLENGIPYLAASYALKKIDVVEVSINRAFRGPALARMIDLTGAPLIVTSDAHLDALDQVRNAIPHIRTLVMVDGATRACAMFPDREIVTFEDVLADRDDHIKSWARDTDPATILFTSGTTGTSKGCVLSHRYAVRTAENMIGPFRVTEDDVNYSFYPLSHIGPAYYDVLPTLMTGGHVILRDRFSVSAFWKEAKRYGVTWFMMLGSVQQLLWSAPSCPEENTHKVTRCWGTPAPVPKKDFDTRFKLHLIPGGGYGSTDAGWVVVPQWDHPGGIVLPHFEVAIHDDNDDPLPPDTPGEMVIRPLEPGVMADGYFDMPEKTLESRRNLWFHTGDIGRMDDEGRFYFMHRIAERIRVKGEMVSGYEVEEGALTHPLVEDCAAIGIPGEFGEEDVMLWAVLKPGARLTEDDLRDYCRERMAKFMVPKHIRFIADMPRTPTGKPEKGKLAAMAKAEQAV